MLRQAHDKLKTWRESTEGPDRAEPDSVERIMDECGWPGTRVHQDDIEDPSLRNVTVHLPIPRHDEDGLTPAGRTMHGVITALQTIKQVYRTGYRSVRLSSTLFDDYEDTPTLMVRYDRRVLESINLERAIGSPDELWGLRDINTPWGLIHHDVTGPESVESEEKR